ncbi:MAG: phosphate/phosphite/phosphonate ABC transporter substrate-binding protein [Deltaproteobacteria bacterium]|nr:MAG: phosphate/phosphite/phosphonate ABC transporter substrate-binding protein [Deltaproteobacteria bacterium]
MKGKRPLLIIVFVLVVGGTLFSLLKGTVSPPKAPLRVAFQVCNSLEENRARFTPLARYLEEKLGRKIIVSHVNTYDFLDKAKKGEFDFIQSNGYIYVLVKEEVGAKLVAREVKADTGKDTGGLIVTRADSPIRTVADLKGKTFVFGPVLSPGGYMCQYYTMVESGFDPETDLARYDFLKGSWKHEKVVYGVYFGAYDAGAVKVGDLERMEREGKIDRKDFRVVASSPPVPNCTFYALPHVGDDLVESMRDALLSLKKSDTVEVNGEVLNVLLRDGIKGYVAGDDSEYDILRKMARRLGLPPYEGD